MTVEGTCFPHLQEREDTVQFVPYRQLQGLLSIQSTSHAECAAGAAGDELHSNMFTVITFIAFVRLIPLLCPRLLPHSLLPL